MGQRRSADKRQCEGPQLAASHPTLEGLAPPRQGGAREPADLCDVYHLQRAGGNLTEMILANLGPIEPPLEPGAAEALDMPLSLLTEGS